MARIMNGLKRGTTLLLKAVVLYSLLFAVDGYREVASANHIPPLFAVLAMAALGVLSGILLAMAMMIVVHPKHGFIAAARSFIEMLGYVVAVMVLSSGACTYFQDHPPAGLAALLGLAAALVLWTTRFALIAVGKKKAAIAADRKGVEHGEKGC